MNPSAEHLAQLELDVDLRVADVWVLAAALPAKSQFLVGKLIRAAYAAGYVAASTGDLSLYTDNGYETPRRCVSPGRFA